ncbi:hypothetical protein SUGI_0294310 [Cryptomeria japonica]|nr:hypothetical protein SUGI_0294310 [Cryptomeria japonica]
MHLLLTKKNILVERNHRRDWEQKRFDNLVLIRNTLLEKEQQELPVEDLGCGFDFGVDSFLEKDFGNVLENTQMQESLQMEVRPVAIEAVTSEWELCSTFNHFATLQPSTVLCIFLILDVVVLVHENAPFLAGIPLGIFFLTAALGFGLQWAVLERGSSLMSDVEGKCEALLGKYAKVRQIKKSTIKEVEVSGSDNGHEAEHSTREVQINEDSSLKDVAEGPTNDESKVALINVPGKLRFILLNDKNDFQFCSARQTLEKIGLQCL